VRYSSTKKVTKPAPIESTSFLPVAKNIIVATMSEKILMEIGVASSMPGGVSSKRMISAAMSAVETARTHLIISLSSSRPFEKNTPAQRQGSVAMIPMSTMRYNELSLIMLFHFSTN